METSVELFPLCFQVRQEWQQAQAEGLQRFSFTRRPHRNGWSLRFSKASSLSSLIFPTGMVFKDLKSRISEFLKDIATNGSPQEHLRHLHCSSAAARVKVQLPSPVEAAQNLGRIVLQHMYAITRYARTLTFIVPLYPARRLSYTPPFTSTAFNSYHAEMMLGNGKGIAAASECLER